MTGWVDGPFGIFPSYEREISVVYWRSERRLAVAVAGMAATAARTAATTGVESFTPLTSALGRSTLIPSSGDGRFSQALPRRTRRPGAPPRRSPADRTPR